jgi:hypothetical protein
MVENEKSLRKWWLYTLLLSFFLTTINSLYAQPKPTPLVPVIISVGVGILLYLALYYFAQVKKGTKLLTFFIWMFFFGMSLNLLWLGFYLTGTMKEWTAGMAIAIAMQTSTFGGLFFYILSYPVSIAFCYLNIQLRRMNRAHSKSTK